MPSLNKMQDDLHKVIHDSESKFCLVFPCNLEETESLLRSNEERQFLYGYGHLAVDKALYSAWVNYARAGNYGLLQMARDALLSNHTITEIMRSLQTIKTKTRQSRPHIELFYAWCGAVVQENGDEWFVGWFQEAMKPLLKVVLPVEEKDDGRKRHLEDNSTPVQQSFIHGIIDGYKLRGIMKFAPPTPSPHAASASLLSEILQRPTISKSLLSLHHDVLKTGDIDLASRKVGRRLSFPGPLPSSPDPNTTTLSRDSDDMIMQTSPSRKRRAVAKENSEHCARCGRFPSPRSTPVRTLSPQDDSISKVFASYWANMPSPGSGPDDDDDDGDDSSEHEGDDNDDGEQTTEANQDEAEDSVLVASHPTPTSGQNNVIIPEERSSDDASKFADTEDDKTLSMSDSQGSTALESTFPALTTTISSTLPSTITSILSAPELVPFSANLPQQEEAQYSQLPIPSPQPLRAAESGAAADFMASFSPETSSATTPLHRSPSPSSSAYESDASNSVVAHALEDDHFFLVPEQPAADLDLELISPLYRPSKANELRRSMTRSPLDWTP